VRQWPEVQALLCPRCADNALTTKLDTAHVKDLLALLRFAENPHVDGGQNPRINGDGQKVGTRFATTSSMQKGWTVGALSTP
jgi:hypothetical protein